MPPPLPKDRRSKPGDEREKDSPRRGPPRKQDFRLDDHPAVKSSKIMEQLVSEYPAVPEYRQLLAMCYRDVPPDRFGPPGEGTKTGFDRAAEILRKLSTEYPNMPDYRFDLCETLARLSPLSFSGFGGAMEAKRREPDWKKAVNVSKGLAEDYPRIPTYVAARARYLSQLAAMQAQVGSDVRGGKEPARRRGDRPEG